MWWKTETSCISGLTYRVIRREIPVRLVLLYLEKIPLYLHLIFQRKKIDNHEENISTVQQEEKE